MKSILTSLAFLFLLSACGTGWESPTSKSAAEAPPETIFDVGGGEDPAPETVPLKLEFCHESVDTGAGQLCVIAPSSTDPDIKDSARPDGKGSGFGFHVIGFPQKYPELKGVWIHFGGSYGKPHNPNNGGEIASLLWLNELMAQGYLVLQLAYANEKSVNGDYCSPTSPGTLVDRCSYKVRQEILTGQDLSDIVDVNPANSYFYRLEAVIRYLENQGVKLQTPLVAGSVDWSGIMVSGHSQGAGHAAMIAKYRRVKGACLIGGPYDTPDSVDVQFPFIADWYMDPEQVTPLKYYGAFVVDTDTNYNSFVKTYEFLGLEKDRDWFESPGMVYTNKDGEPIPVEDGHPASIAAIELAPQRARACFQAAAAED